MKSLRITTKFTDRTSETFKRYLDEVNSYPVLSNADEDKYAKESALGNLDSREKLILHNLRFVISVAKNYVTQTTDIEDLVNEGNIGLIMAAEKYDGTTGFKFITYAVFWIRKKIIEYINTNSKLIRLPANKIGDINKVNNKLNVISQKDNKTSNVMDIVDDEYTDKELNELERLSTIEYKSFDSNEFDDGFKLYDIIPDNSCVHPDTELILIDKKNVMLNNLLVLKPKNRRIIIDLFGLETGIPMTLNEVAEKVDLTNEAVRLIREKSLNILRDKIKNTEF